MPLSLYELLTLAAKHEEFRITPARLTTLTALVIGGYVVCFPERGMMTAVLTVDGELLLEDIGLKSIAALARMENKLDVPLPQQSHGNQGHVSGSRVCARK